MDLTTVLMFLALLEEQGGAAPQPPGNLPGPIPSPQPYVPPQPAPYVPPQPAPAPHPSPAPAPPAPHVVPKPMPIGPKPAPAPPAPHVVPKPMPFPTPVQPQGLPPFPGPQWTPCPTTAAIVARAVYWNAILWNFPTKTIRQATAQEQLGGQWVTFKAAWHPDASGNPQGLMATEAYCLGGAQPPAPPPGPAPTGKPDAVGPEPELGGWQTDVAYIKRYQTALSYLSFTMNVPAYNTQGVDGSAGPNTQAAVKAFQADQGLVPVDGEVGSATSSAIDTALGYPVPPGGYPPPSAGGGGGGGYPASPGS